MFVEERVATSQAGKAAQPPQESVFVEERVATSQADKAGVAAAGD
jgi:hypothetical protein